ncbi:hypothetical protein PCE1_002499 [Barthelona sp. PCE]
MQFSEHPDSYIRRFKEIGALRAFADSSSNFSEVISIDFSDKQLKSADLAFFQDMQLNIDLLDLGANCLDDSIVKYIKHLNIAHLVLSGNNLSSNVLKAFHKYNCEYTTLNLRFNNMYSINEFPNVENIDLSFNEIFNFNVLPMLPLLRTVRSINLSHNYLRFESCHTIYHKCKELGIEVKLSENLLNTEQANLVSAKPTERLAHLTADNLELVDKKLREIRGITPQSVNIDTSRQIDQDEDEDSSITDLSDLSDDDSEMLDTKTPVARRGNVPIPTSTLDISYPSSPTSSLAKRLSTEVEDDGGSSLNSSIASEKELLQSIRQMNASFSHLPSRGTAIHYVPSPAIVNNAFTDVPRKVHPLAASQAVSPVTLSPMRMPMTPVSIPVSISNHVSPPQPTKVAALSPQNAPISKMTVPVMNDKPDGDSDHLLRTIEQEIDLLKRFLAEKQTMYASLKSNVLNLQDIDFEEQEEPEMRPNIVFNVDISSPQPAKDDTFEALLNQTPIESPMSKMMKEEIVFDDDLTSETSVSPIVYQEGTGVTPGMSSEFPEFQALPTPTRIPVEPPAKRVEVEQTVVVTEPAVHLEPVVVDPVIQPEPVVVGAAEPDKTLQSDAEVENDVDVSDSVEIVEPECVEDIVEEEVKTEVTSVDDIEKEEVIVEEEENEVLEEIEEPVEPEYDDVTDDEDIPESVDTEWKDPTFVNIRDSTSAEFDMKTPQPASSEEKHKRPVRVVVVLQDQESEDGLYQQTIVHIDLFDRTPSGWFSKSEVGEHYQAVDLDGNSAVNLHNNGKYINIQYGSGKNKGMLVLSSAEHREELLNILQPCISSLNNVKKSVKKEKKAFDKQKKQIVKEADEIRERNIKRAERRAANEVLREKYEAECEEVQARIQKRKELMYQPKMEQSAIIVEENSTYVPETPKAEMVPKLEPKIEIEPQPKVEEKKKEEVEERKEVVPRAPSSTLFCAMYPYTGKNESYATFKKGDILEVIGLKKGWLVVLNDQGDKQFAPPSYLQRHV